MTYRLWVNEARTVLVRLWDNDQLEIATREKSWDTWRPPERLTEEIVPEPNPQGSA